MDLQQSPLRDVWARMTLPSSRLTLPLTAALAAFAFSASPALAQDGGRVISLGGGVDLKPKFPGSDEVGIGPLPYFDLRREGAPLSFEAPDEGIGLGLLGNDNGFDVGPSINFLSKRQEEDVGAPVGNVGFTVEVGAFAQAFLGENFRVRAEARQGLGGHEGLVGDLSADFVLRDRDNYVFSIGPRARWGDNDYHDAYFGVTPAIAAATGLAAYNPGSGFHSVGAIAGITHMIGRRVGVYAYAGYDRLIGDAADSPIVRTYGSRDQFSGGLALFFTFGLGD
jgi:outer membrane protein